jgi:integrase
MQEAKNNQFTDKYIKSLTPTENQKKFYDVREKSGRGFGITIFPSGEKSFIFIYHHAGRKRRMTLGKYPHCTLAAARRLHNEALKTLEEGQDPALLKKLEKIETCNASTIEGLIHEYIEKWAKPRKRSWKEDERILHKDVLSSWGKRKAKDITKRDMLLLLDKIKERNAPIAANRTLACVRRMFNFAIERDILNANPCLTIKAPAKENRRDRCLTLEEIKSFWLGLENAPMSESSKLILKLQLLTAQRKGEIVSAEWSEIDLQSGWWTIPGEKAKNGQPHRVPLSKPVIELLQTVKNLSGTSRWLFPSPRQDKPTNGPSVDHAVRRSLSTFTDVAPFTPHDLRRTAASHMTSIGISRLVVSKLLNHVENSVTAIYDRHSYDAEKLNALEAWGKKLHDIINDVTANNVITLKTVNSNIGST